MSITASHITKTFGAYTALAGVDLSVPAGSLTALLGPSGSGKTTLLRIIAGLEFADSGSGSISFHGEDVTNVPAGQRGVGFVFQHYALFRHMTVFDNIAFGLNVRPRKQRPSRDEIAERVNKLLKLVQLENLGKRFPTQLSGGQRQRVALARALAVDPKVLLLDEPFGALDARVRKDLRRWLRHFHDEIGLTTLFVTHDQEEALEIADEVVVMNNARIEQVGSPQQVYDHPASPFVYQFLGNVNKLPAAVFADAEAEARNGFLFVRPHDVELLRADDGRPGHTATVRHLHAAGPAAHVQVETANGDRVEAEISRAELATLALNVGDPVRLRLRRTAAFAEDYAI